MTFQEFIEKWNGKYCEVAGSANAQNQCVDLANAYIRDVLNLPIIEWTNAKDFPSKAGDAYEYILNSPTNIPKEGDLVIWGGTTAGHIAIFVEGNADSFKSFDQNFPTGSPCHIQNHNYLSPPVLGWLHPKHVVINNQVCMPKEQAEDFQRVKDGWNKLREKLNVEDSVTVVLAEIEKLIGYEDAVIQKDNALSDAQSDIATLKTEITRLQQLNDTQSAEASVLTKKAFDLETKYVQSTHNYERALEKINELEKTLTTEDSGLTLIIKGIRKLVGR